jgi:hypothetical protein
MLQASNQKSVLPTPAEAVVQCRLLPGDTLCLGWHAEQLRGDRGRRRSSADAFALARPLVAQKCIRQGGADGQHSEELLPRSQQIADAVAWVATLFAF